MPFNLGFLGSSPPPAVPSGHKGGSAGLTNAVNMIVDNRRQDEYLQRSLAQDKYAREQDFNAKVEKEQGRRREAIDAWLGAVRSGNRADVWVLGKRLNAMGINVQMPTAFSATGVPGEGEMAVDGPAAPGFVDSQGRPTSDPATHPTAQSTESEAESRRKTAAAVKEFRDTHTHGGYPKQSVTGAAVDKLGQDTVGALGGTFEPPGSAAPGGERFFDADAGEDVSEQEFNRRLGPPGTTTSGTSVANPFGPAGPTTMKAPTATWRVTDPVTGTNIEISPEEILQDQEREIDQSFGPLTKMPGLDPVAQRAYQIGHEYAKGQIGFLPPKEAVAAGMKAADRYMTHMYQQGMVSAANLKAARKAGGGGGGGAKPNFGGTELTKGEVDVTKAIHDDVRSTAVAVQNQDNYKKVEAAQRAAEAAEGKLETGTSLGERSAFRELMTAIEPRLTDADAAYYQAAAGIKARMQNILGYWTEGGKLSPAQMREVRAVMGQARALMARQMKKIKDKGAAATDAVVNNYKIKDPKRRADARNVGRSQIGAPTVKAEDGEGGDTKAKKKATPEASRLLE